MLVCVCACGSVHATMSAVAVQTETHLEMPKGGEADTVNSSDMKELMRKVEVSKSLIMLVL